jgi:hypothetical protein
MSILIDLEDYVIKEPLKVSKGGKGKVRVKRYLTDPFLKGPIPIPWLLKAASLGKCALKVGLILWYMDGMRGGRTFRMGRGDIGRLLGVSRLTVWRGIKRLEKGGLIFVLREPGRKFVVTMNRKSAAWEDNYEG